MLILFIVIADTIRIFDNVSKNIVILNLNNHHIKDKNAKYTFNIGKRF